MLSTTVNYFSFCSLLSLSSNKWVMVDWFSTTSSIVFFHVVFSREVNSTFKSHRQEGTRRMEHSDDVPSDVKRKKRTGKEERTQWPCTTRSMSAIVTRTKKLDIRSYCENDWQLRWLFEWMRIEHEITLTSEITPKVSVFIEPLICCSPDNSEQSC
jgi:hypothetical protein